MLPLWFDRQYPWSLRHFRSVRIASLCLQLVYYMLFSLHNRVGPNVLSWRYVINGPQRDLSCSVASLSSMCHSTTLRQCAMCHFSLFGWFYGYSWRYVTDLALRNWSLSPWSLRHFRSVRIASLCLQLVYYMLFTLHNRVVLRLSLALRNGPSVT